MSSTSAAKSGAVGAPLRAVARVAATVAAVVLIFWSTSASMVATWNSSGTYSHGFFVVPAFLWLVWGRRDELARLPIAPTRWALLPLAIAGSVWLIADWMALALPAQLALVAMVPLAIAGVLGLAWVRALLFPLAFLLFAVPIGESIVPVLMDWTADFTVTALRASGVPVYRDGLHFEIPSGSWSVVDSCSGIRYLFASLAASSLYSWTIYRGTVRRLTFVGLAAAIAVVANWLRAYGIVMLGHLSNNRIAVGVDHLIYGGLFFAVIMAAVFLLGVVWREDARSSRLAERGALAEVRAASRHGAHKGGWLSTVAATVATLAVWPILSFGYGRSDEHVAARPDLQPASGWAEVQELPWHWRPVVQNPSAVWTRAFSKGNETVGLYVGIFGRSTAESKLTSAMNRFLAPDGVDPRWRLTDQGPAEARFGDSLLQVHSGVLVGSGTRLLAWQWYWVDGAVTASPTRAALLQLLARLRGRHETSAWVAIHARETDSPGRAAGVLRGFVSDMAGPLDAALRQAAAVSATGGLSSARDRDLDSAPSRPSAFFTVVRRVPP